MSAPFEYPKKGALARISADFTKDTLVRSSARQRPLTRAHRPVIYVGGGAKISGASEEGPVRLR